jgi:peptidoglycan/LPS O-acetylase OafA/YrhL
MRKEICPAWVSLQDRLVATDGRPSGFDYLRLWLAISVVFIHCPTTTNGADPFVDTPLNAYVRAILPMFFALSGFLVAGSLERCKTLLGFLGLRVIRIYPALAVEVVLSAFLIGALVTTYPWSRYYSDPLFLLYLRTRSATFIIFCRGSSRITHGRGW